jgi:predicted SAM-dependent methyltransferase
LFAASREMVFKIFVIMNNFVQTIKLFIKFQLSKANIKNIINEKNEINLEVGAGDKKGEKNWITIDISNQCDIFWDLRKGIPFPNESITKIYSSHFMEHLSFKEAQIFLDECLRVLVKGGIFSICVPNAKIYAKAYLDPDYRLPEEYIVYKQAFNRTTKIDYLNYIAYMDGHHKYMFDEENLIHILESKGFKNVHLRAFDPALDLKIRDFESIYAEALK